MQIQAFAIYDTKADAYLQPFFTNNKHTALRMFGDLVNDPNHQFAKHAGDYVLFQIGSYNDQTGTLEKLSANINLGLALEFQQPDALSLEDNPHLQEVQ